MLHSEYTASLLKRSFFSATHIAAILWAFHVLLLYPVNIFLFAYAGVIVAGGGWLYTCGAM